MIIDFHSHILPGIDDGSKDIEMTEIMLKAAVSQDIGHMVVTPHFYGDHMSIRSFVENRQKAVQQALPLFREYGVGLTLGAEVAFFHGISRATELEKLCFNAGDGRLIMIEMPFRPWEHSDLTEIERLINIGYHPIMAHLDRFYPLQKNKKVIPALLEMPVIVQINASALLQMRSRRTVMKLIKDGEAILLGSDCHNITSRVQNLKAAREILEKKCGEAFLKEMDAFGERLLRNQKKIKRP